MSILIKGMEMLTSGELLIIITPNGEVRYKKSVASAWDKTTAIPIPPHGRTIDADALPSKDVYDQNWREYGYSQYVIDAAPTIIPAEEE